MVMFVTLASAVLRLSSCLYSRRPSHVIWAFRVFYRLFTLIEYFNFIPRICGQACENLVLVAVPAFVFMGVMMERSGIANDLLYCVQVLLKRVPGALALAVTVMGTILAE